MRFLLRFLLKLTFFAGILAILVGICGYFYFSQDLPEIEEFDSKKRKVINIEFSDGELINSYGNKFNIEAKFYELPKELINAVIAIEDQNFFSHFGFDIKAIMRAFWVNQKAGKIKQGASTITQQLAKLLFLTPEKNMKRKIQELILAIRLERFYTKEQILTLYLNKAYFGGGAYGIRDAAKIHFNKKVADLNLQESAMLAGFLKAPSVLSSEKNKYLAKKRAQLVVKKMIESGYLIEDGNDDFSYNNSSKQRFYFADFVKNNFQEFLGEPELESVKITIKTTLNKRVQEVLEQNVEKFLVQNENTLKNHQLSVIVMDETGAILALAGGKNYQESQFNHAIFAKRQSGSLFKTFVYLSAFEQGKKPSDIYLDEKIEFSNWLPNNYKNEYFGQTTLRDAFAKSLNSVAIQLAKEVGLKNVANLANKLGILSEIDQNDLTIALGTSEVSLLEMVASFAAIKNGGIPIIPYYITEISSEEFGKVYQRQTSGFSPILKQESINFAHEILREVVASGTAKAANIAPEVKGKTGTSQDNRDAWFVGFDENLVIGVWIGKIDKSPNSSKIFGGGLPAQLFGKILRDLRS